MRLLRQSILRHPIIQFQSWMTILLHLLHFDFEHVLMQFYGLKPKLDNLRAAR